MSICGRVMFVSFRKYVGIFMSKRISCGIAYNMFSAQVDVAGIGDCAEVSYLAVRGLFS